ncbi:MAG: LptF/LptG family permease [Proteobacteria bacterium]|nr:LptF/LptG family permease [Pseudomonadota bacterium]
MRVTRYLAMSVFIRSSLALVLLAVVYMAIDFVEASSWPGASLGRLVSLYVFRLPMIISQILPLALTLGVLLALASSRSRGEWNAMRSIGISPFGLSTRLLIVPFLGMCFSTLLLAQLAPRALAVWQSGFDPALSVAVSNSHWCKGGRQIVQEESPLGFRTVIERRPDGSPLLWARAGAGVSDAETLVWRQANGWQEEAPQELDAAQCAAVTKKEILNDSHTSLPGASLTLVELGIAISQSEKRGISTAPLRAELALRIALIAACLIVPLLGLGLSLAGEESRSTRLVGRGIIAATAFWLSLAVAWNGAVVGAWSPTWVSVGIPLFYLGMSVVAVMVTGRR